MPSVVDMTLDESIHVCNQDIERIVYWYNLQNTYQIHQLECYYKEPLPVALSKLTEYLMRLKQRKKFEE